MKGIPENIPDLEEPFLICLLIKAAKIPRGLTTDVSKFVYGFMLQMDFSCFYVESIREFTSSFVTVYYATTYPFGLTSRSKRPPLDILKFIVTTLRNQLNKFTFTWFDKDRALSRFSGFTRTCQNTNIIVQTIGGYASSLNGKSDSPIKTLTNITIALLLNSSHKK